MSESDEYERHRADLYTQVTKLKAPKKLPVLNQFENINFTPTPNHSPLNGDLVFLKDVFAAKLKIATHPNFYLLPVKYKNMIVDVEKTDSEHVVIYQVLLDQLEEFTPRSDLNSGWDRSSALPDSRRTVGPRK